MAEKMMPCQFPGQGRKRQWTEEDEEEEEFDEVDDCNDSVKDDDDGKDDYDPDDDPQFICGSIVDPEVWQKYFKEIEESESFDIPFYPGPSFHHSVVPYKNFLSDPDEKQTCRDMCTTAIQKFNSENLKNYVLDDVVDVNVSFAAGIFYYMTFEATDRDKANAPKTFQAQVWQPIGGPIEIDFCRFKTYLRYREELIKNAAYLGTPGKGILAADESSGTIGKRLLSVNVENVESNRSALCELLFCTPGALQYLSGVTLFEETLYQKTAGGNPFVDVLTEGGVLPGIKVDKGTVELPGTNGETTTQGLDGLAERCSKYYEAGARFTKWRAVLKIGLNEPSELAINEPSELAINENANGLARFAIICQRNGLVPIIEPEILVDGPHDINKCADVTERVLASCYKALNDQHVLLEGTLLKLNMVTPGSESAKVAPEVVAEYTVRVLQRTVPLGVPAIVFLSGGQNEEEATVNLNAMNKLQTEKPWSLSFSFGSALQQSTLKAWAGKEENVQKAQAAFLTRCRANSEATLGKYAGAANLSEGASKNLHVKDYNS